MLVYCKWVAYSELFDRKSLAFVRPQLSGSSFAVIPQMPHRRNRLQMLQWNEDGKFSFREQICDGFRHCGSEERFTRGTTDLPAVAAYDQDFQASPSYDYFLPRGSKLIFVNQMSFGQSFVLSCHWPCAVIELGSSCRKTSKCVRNIQLFSPRSTHSTSFSAQSWTTLSTCCSRESRNARRELSSICSWRWW